MSEPVALISSAAITPEAFAAFLRKIGGVSDPDDPTQGRLSRGNQHVWLFLRNNDLGHIGEVSQSSIVQKLGAVPRSNVVIEISRNPGSERLAVEAASAFVQQWPAVLFNLLDKVFSAQEVVQLRDANQGFG